MTSNFLCWNDVEIWPVLWLKKSILYLLWYSPYLISRYTSLILCIIWLISFSSNLIYFYHVLQRTCWYMQSYLHSHGPLYFHIICGADSGKNTVWMFGFINCLRNLFWSDWAGKVTFHFLICNRLKFHFQIGLHWTANGQMNLKSRVWKNNYTSTYLLHFQ